MTDPKPSPAQDDKAIDIQDTKQTDEKKPPNDPGFELFTKDSGPKSKESRNDQ
jgi:hypothetical protein